MYALILEPGNLPFAVSLGLMLALAGLEAAAAFLGTSPSAAIDNLLPDFDLEVDVDVEVDADIGDAAAGTNGILTGVLHWLSFGRVPTMVLLIVFLTVFGLAGLFLQSLVYQVQGAVLPGWFASIPALAIALPAVRYIGRALASVIPMEVSDAIRQDALIGATATITLGVAAIGQPAEARISRKSGGTLYVKVEPDQEGATYSQGSKVRLIRREGIVFKVHALTASAAS